MVGKWICSKYAPPSEHALTIVCALVNAYNREHASSHACGRWVREPHMTEARQDGRIAIGVGLMCGLWKRGEECLDELGGSTARRLRPKH